MEMMHADHPGSYNPLMEEKWGARLRAFGFRPGPAYSASPDGIYYFFPQDDSSTGRKSTDIQLIIVGPMEKTPGQYAQMLGDYWVRECGVLPPSENAPAALQVLVNERGFWFIILRCGATEERPRFDYRVTQAKAA